MFTSLGKNYCEGNQNEMFVNKKNKYNCKQTLDYAEISQVLSEQVHSQYFSSWKSMSIEGIALEYLKIETNNYTHGKISS